MPLDADKLGNLDPKLAWALIALAFATSFLLPIVLAKLSKGDKKPEQPAPPSTTQPGPVEIRHVEKPSLDASSQLLVKMVENLEERAKRAEAKSDEQQKRIDELEEALFEARRKADQDRQEIATLRFSVQQLTQQLIARGNSGGAG